MACNTKSCKSLPCSGLFGIPDFWITSTPGGRVGPSDHACYLIHNKALPDSNGILIKSKYTAKAIAKLVSILRSAAKQPLPNLPIALMLLFILARRFLLVRAFLLARHFLSLIWPHGQTLHWLFLGLRRLLLCIILRLIAISTEWQSRKICRYVVVFSTRQTTTRNAWSKFSLVLLMLQAASRKRVYPVFLFYLSDRECGNL